MFRMEENDYKKWLIKFASNGIIIDFHKKEGSIITTDKKERYYIEKKLIQRRKWNLRIVFKENMF